MKFALLSLLFVLSSCGEYKATVEHKGKVEYVLSLKVCEGEKPEDKKACLEILKKLLDLSK